MLQISNYRVSTIKDLPLNFTFQIGNDYPFTLPEQLQNEYEIVLQEIKIKNYLPTQKLKYQC